MWNSRKLISDENESAWAEFWKELKFAIDIRAGDTKPANPDAKSRASSSKGSKSIIDDDHPYGIIEDKKHDSSYAHFNENVR